MSALCGGTHNVSFLSSPLLVRLGLVLGLHSSDGNVKQNGLVLSSHLLDHVNFLVRPRRSPLSLLVVDMIGVGFVYLLFGVAIIVLPFKIRRVATSIRVQLFGVLRILAKGLGEVAQRSSDASSPLALIAVILAVC